MAAELKIDDECICGGARSNPNPDCERCRLVAEVYRLRSESHDARIAVWSAINAARSALVPAGSLYALGYNVRNCEGCPDGIDETGCTKAEYEAEYDRIMGCIAGARKELRRLGWGGGGDDSRIKVAGEVARLRAERDAALAEVGWLIHRPTQDEYTDYVYRDGRYLFDKPVSTWVALGRARMKAIASKPAPGTAPPAGRGEVPGEVPRG